MGIGNWELVIYNCPFVNLQPQIKADKRRSTQICGRKKEEGKGKTVNYQLSTSSSSKSSSGLRS
ncbi:MAG: hypothetical protein HC786_08915 [Richelia sp. CSU_2_1]|nr:hypothetical protein [Microcoleus sp. SM1_3_4]NJR22267.1 hypothetical protein [Richelia sp. CSU_2_1]